MLSPGRDGGSDRHGCSAAHWRCGSRPSDKHVAFAQVIETIAVAGISRESRADTELRIVHAIVHEPAIIRALHSPGPYWATATWNAASEICSTSVSLQSRPSATLTWRAGARRQDRPASRGGGALCDLRSRFPRFLLRLPTSPQPARCAGCCLSRDNPQKDKLSARCRHPRVLRCHRPRMAGEVS